MDRIPYSSSRIVPATTTTGRCDVESYPAWLDTVSQVVAPLVPNPRLVAMTAPDSAGAEKFRTLAVRLHDLQEQRDLKRVVITSTIKGEGKSVVAANLAITCSHRQRTLLMDGDLRQSGLAELFGSHDFPGLTDWWDGTREISECLRLVRATPLWYLPVGRKMIQPLDILQSQRLADLLVEISTWFSCIIIDCPPLAPVVDPTVWITHSDGALLVVRQGKTPKRVLLKTLQEGKDLKLLGVVMNGWQEASPQYYGQYHQIQR